MTNYKQAFAQVGEASEAVLLDYDQTLKQSKAFLAGRQPASGEDPLPYPLTWKDVLVNQAAGAPDDIETRRLALSVVAQYNDVLTQLAEGKSAAQIKTGASGLVTSLGKFVAAATGSAIPGLGAIGGLVSTLAEQLEKARLREEFIAALRNGAPVVDKILDALIDDIGSHYDLRASLAGRERLLIVKSTTAQVRGMLAVVKAHAVQAKDVAALQKIENDLNSALLPARRELLEYPYKLAGAAPAGAPAFDETDAGQLQLAIAELGRLSNAYQDNIRQMQAITALLAKYRTLLASAKASLAALRRGVDKPQDVNLAVDDLLTLAFGIKRDLEDLRTALRSPG
ncbi:MAG TPA: hypothetical protein VMK05_15850 [Burkholderiales bacterium]|nr:hypothetical protein [Burkholderiales bacterium]